MEMNDNLLNELSKLSLEELLITLGKHEPIYVLMNVNEFDIFSRVRKLPSWPKVQSIDSPLQFKWTNKHIGRLLEMVL